MIVLPLYDTAVLLINKLFAWNSIVCDYFFQAAIVNLCDYICQKLCQNFK